MSHLTGYGLVNSQRGIGLPAAIFVITLMAVIAVGINVLLQQNAQSFEEEINLQRAFYAAESGAGFALNTLYPPEEFPTYGVTAECGFTRNYNLTVAGMNSCTVEVGCENFIVDSENFAIITSTGSCDNVERAIQVRTSY